MSETGNERKEWFYKEMYRGKNGEFERESGEMGVSEFVIRVVSPILLGFTRCCGCEIS